MRILNTSILIFSSVILIALGILGCGHKYEVEIAAIDSLLEKNNRTFEYLKIDLVTINERMIEMKGQISILQKMKPDSSSMEFEINLEKYKGIQNIYKKFLENYDVINGKIRFNKKQLSDLKNSVVDEKISGTDYKLAYEKEAENVSSNLYNAQLFGGKISQLEPDYQRLSAYFDPQIARIIQQFPELKLH